MTAKHRAAIAALDHVQSGMLLGLGTGSTADLFLEALAAALKDGRLSDIRGVPTSKSCELRARQFGIPLIELASGTRCDVTIDGADEVDPLLNLVKGGGGALLREKIVAENSDRLVIIVDDSKLVSTLCTKLPLPVEVLPFGHEVQERFLADLGCEPHLRVDQRGMVRVTDNGNYIYDCSFAGGVSDPFALREKLRARAGIVGYGLFLDMANMVIVGAGDGVNMLTR